MEMETTHLEPNLRRVGIRSTDLLNSLGVMKPSPAAGTVPKKGSSAPVINNVSNGQPNTKGRQQQQQQKQAARPTSRNLSLPLPSPLPPRRPRLQQLRIPAWTGIGLRWWSHSLLTDSRSLPHHFSHRRLQHRQRQQHHHLLYLRRPQQHLPRLSTKIQQHVPRAL